MAAHNRSLVSFKWMFIHKKWVDLQAISNFEIKPYSAYSRTSTFATKRLFFKYFQKYLLMIQEICLAILADFLQSCFTFKNKQSKAFLRKIGCARAPAQFFQDLCAHAQWFLGSLALNNENLSGARVQAK